MGEWKRVFSGRRRVAMLLLPLLCLALFFYQKADGDFSALNRDAGEYRQLLDTYRDSSAEEIEVSLPTYREWNKNENRVLAQAEHQQSYGKYLTQVQKQAANMQATTIFGGDPNSFVYRNILRTAQDFAGCSAEGIRFGNFRAVQDWLEFAWADWAFLAAMVLLVLAFLEERKKGLTAVIRACPAGRGRLQGCRLAVLLGYSAAMTALLYGLPLGLSLWMDGGWADLAAPVQSMVEFRKCTAQLTVLEFLGQFFLVKSVCGFLVGLLIWFLLSFLTQVQLCLPLTVAGLAGEYLLYSFIPAQSIFSPLRYVNVFSWVFTSGLYGNYVNINFFGYPVQNRALLLALLGILTVVLGAAMALVLTRRHPFGNKDRLGRWVHLWNRVGDVFRRRLGLYGFEWYKLLFLTVGGLFLVLGPVLIGEIYCNSGAYLKLEDGLYRQYLAQAQGPVSQATRDYIAQSWQQLEALGLMGAMGGEFSAALERLEETVSALPEGAWLVDEVSFLNIYGSDAWLLQRKNALTAMLYLVACLSTLFACEDSGDVRKVLRSTPGGRQRLFWVKYALALSLTGLVWLVVFGREWLAAGKLLGEAFLQAPCSSLEIIQAWPGTVGGFLTLLYGSKLLGMVTVSNLCIFFGERSKGFEKAFLISGAVLLLPAVVYSFGVDEMAVFTPMAFLADGNVLMAGPWLLLPWLALSLAALAAAKRHWCR